MLRNLTQACGFARFSGPNEAFKHVDLRKDYYSCLDVSFEASDLEIKKSYLKQAKKLHPDRNPGGHAEFTEVQEAYQVLSNPKAKNYYDMNSVLHADKFQQRSSHNPNMDDLNSRNQHFYDDMSRKGFDEAYEEELRSHYRSNQDPRQKTETEEEARERRKIEEEIELLRRNLMGRNPLWHQANCMMNYQERIRREQEKERQLANLPGGKSALSFLRRMMNRYTK